MELPPSEFLDARNGGYYVVRTRISLESVAWALSRGETIDDLMADFPALQSREDLAGVIHFIRSHPAAVDAVLAESEREWEEARKLNPPELVEKMRKYRESKDLKSA